MNTGLYNSAAPRSYPGGYAIWAPLAGRLGCRISTLALLKKRFTTLGNHGPHISVG